MRNQAGKGAEDRAEKMVSSPASVANLVSMLMASFLFSAGPVTAGISSMM
jgi:hypothetical protein